MLLCIYLQHPNYNSGAGTIPNDISLIELSKPLTYSSSVKPIALPSSNQEFVYQQCAITGWGRTCGTCTISKICLNSTISFYLHHPILFVSFSHLVFFFHFMSAKLTLLNTSSMYYVHFLLYNTGMCTL